MYVDQNTSQVYADHYVLRSYFTLSLSSYILALQFLTPTLRSHKIDCSNMHTKNE